MSEEKIREMCDDIYQGGDWQPMIDYVTDLQEKLKIATAMLTRGTYPEQNEGDNDFDRQFISIDKLKNEVKLLRKMKVKGEVFTTAVKFAILVLESLMEENKNGNN